MPNVPTSPAWVATPTVGGDNNAWGTELNNILLALAVMSVLTTAANLAPAFTTALETIVLATGGAGGITVTLPNAANGQGKLFVVKKVDAGVGTITINSAGGLVERGASYLLTTQGQWVRFVSDGTNWDII